MWALIVDGVVWEITDIDPNGRFHPSLLWVECGDDVEVGYLYDGKKFIFQMLELSGAVLAPVIILVLNSKRCVRKFFVIWFLVDVFP